MHAVVLEGSLVFYWPEQLPGLQLNYQNLPGLYLVVLRSLLHSSVPVAWKHADPGRKYLCPAVA